MNGDSQAIPLPIDTFEESTAVGRHIKARFVLRPCKDKMRTEIYDALVGQSVLEFNAASDVEYKAAEVLFRFMSEVEQRMRIIETLVGVRV